MDERRDHIAKLANELLRSMCEIAECDFLAYRLFGDPPYDMLVVHLIVRNVRGYGDKPFGQGIMYPMDALFNAISPGWMLVQVLMSAVGQFLRRIDDMENEHGTDRKAGTEVCESAPDGADTRNTGTTPRVPPGYKRAGPRVGAVEDVVYLNRTMQWAMNIECTNVTRTWEQLIEHYARALGPHYHDEGVGAGEVIAWRAWRVTRDVGESIRLTSVAAHVSWEPGEVVVSRPTEGAYGGLIDMRDTRPELGTHGWISRRHAEEYMRRISAGNGDNPLMTMALGQVKLWGQIYEHEYGYRAEFARVHRIASVWYALDPLYDLKFLQRIYG